MLGTALAVLNGALTFVNVWPTPMIRWDGRLSVELAAALLALALARGAGWVPSRRTVRLMATVGVFLILGRYADVTVQSLFGREINLYWDSRHFMAVGEMLTTVSSPLLLVAIIAGLVAVPALLFALLYWAIMTVSTSVAERHTRHAMAVIAGLGLVLAAIQLPREEPFTEIPQFASAISPTYMRQARSLFREMSGIGRKPIPPAPSFTSSFSQVQGADVFAIFLESYGATSWDRAEYARALAPARARLDEAIRDTGRAAASAYAESPTFGGSSWLAHVSFLAGTEVRDGDTNLRLMSEHGRTTLLTAFKHHGYRTVAVMPGLRRSWPEGQFYGFDEIYGEQELAYQGPSFGWWDVTDQYALARMDALAVAPRTRPPVFVFFPTVSTHAPFLPSPPYQADWSRMLSRDPYDEQVLLDAWGDTPDWLNLGPGYVKAMTYSLDTIGGYLRLRGDRDFVVVLVGDHQPPAVVTGDGASWEVPVHVITSRRPILDRLQALGFANGMTPHHPAVARIDELMPILLDAFGDR